MNNLTLFIGRWPEFYDISELLAKCSWSGERGSAPRSLEATIFDSEQLAGRVPVDCGEGQDVIFYEGEEELFQGLLMKEKKGNGRTLTIKACDVCIRFVKNKSSFTYTNCTATQIFLDCCAQLGLEAGHVADTGHVIGELVKKAATYWDAIEDALSQTYKATGERFYVYADHGLVNLIKRTVIESMPVLEPETSVISYERTRSIENTKTRLKLATSEGVLKNSTILSDLEAKIGQFQEYENVDEQITETEVVQRINTFKEEQGIVEQTMKLKTAGDSRVKSGGCVLVNIPDIDTQRIMFVESDTHVWEKGGHTMTLKLDCATSAGTVPESPGSAVKEAFKTGDAVWFKGGFCYESSYSYAKGYLVSPGPARIYKDPSCELNGGAHPWCLLTEDWSLTSVYGWVDEGSFE